MLRDELRNYHWHKWTETSDTERSKPFKLDDDLVDCLRYLSMSRPDWFEHPKTDIYGRVIDDADDITFRDTEEDISDILEDSEDILQEGGSVYD